MYLAQDSIGGSLGWAELGGFSGLSWSESRKPGQLRVGWDAEVENAHSCDSPFLLHVASHPPISQPRLIVISWNSSVKVKVNKEFWSSVSKLAQQFYCFLLVQERGKALQELVICSPSWWEEVQRIVAIFSICHKYQNILRTTYLLLLTMQPIHIFML